MNACDGKPVVSLAGNSVVAVADEHLSSTDVDSSIGSSLFNSPRTVRVRRCHFFERGDYGTVTDLPVSPDMVRLVLAMPGLAWDTDGL